MPNDLTFNWNLINKTNKQAKQTRDIEIKNNLTVTRGEVEGDNGGEGGSVFRNNYKGHMDKTKEGVEARKGGGFGWGWWGVG